MLPRLPNNFTSDQKIRGDILKKYPILNKEWEYSFNHGWIDLNELINGKSPRYQIHSPELYDPNNIFFIRKSKDSDDNFLLNDAMFDPWGRKFPATMRNTTAFIMSKSSSPIMDTYYDAWSNSVTDFEEPRKIELKCVTYYGKDYLTLKTLMRFTVYDTSIKGHIFKCVHEYDSK